MFEEGPLFSIKNDKFNVVVLAAGLGTRLKPETDYIPKALVQLGKERAVDYIVKKYQYVADRVILAVGYCADLLENYCRGKYPTLNLQFSREEVSDLAGPGTSLLYALDSASSRLPTVVTFCDYLLQDTFSLEQDALGLCRPGTDAAVLGTYKTVGKVVHDAVTDLLPNPDMEENRKDGFTGLFVCRETKLLKAITYGVAQEKGVRQVDYAFDVVRPYIHKVRSVPCYLSKILEFGTEETLAQARSRIHGRDEVHPA